MSATRRALARALVVNPDEGGPPLDPGSDEVLAAIDRALANLPADERLGARYLLWVVRWMPLIVGPRRGRLDKLARDDARAFLERLRLSKWHLLRYLFFCLKSIISLAYFAQPSTWPAIGYDGPYLGRVAVTRIKPPFASGELPQAPPPPVAL